MNDISFFCTNIVLIDFLVQGFHRVICCVYKGSFYPGCKEVRVGIGALCLFQAFSRQRNIRADAAYTAQR